MKTIGVIGTGNIGGTIARLAVQAGYDVVVSNSRGAETLRDVASELGARARTGTPAEAARDGDIVVVSVPRKAYADLPAEALAGKVVIDTTNYYPDRDGIIPDLVDGRTTTSEFLQVHLPQAKVVRVFHTIYFRALGALPRPEGAADRSALPLAGDDTDAKAAVTYFLDQVGYDAVDAGALADGWRFEQDTPAYTAPYVGPGGLDDIVAAGVEEIRKRLAAMIQ